MKVGELVRVWPCKETSHQAMFGIILDHPKRCGFEAYTAEMVLVNGKQAYICTSLLEKFDDICD